MGRNDLYITVPNLFRCPISLDVMKSPVSLCTGVTYDRSSIQHWLDSGHDTCPATMQVLITKDFVPNLTLHRLINLWDQPSPPSKRVSDQQVRRWIQEISQEDSMRKILEFLECSEENIRFLVKFEGFLEAVVGVLGGDNVEIQILELTVGILDLISSLKGTKEILRRLVSSISDAKCLSSLISIISNGNSSTKSKSEAVRVMETITINNESKRFVAETQNLIPILLRLLKTETSSPDAVLSLLTSLTITRAIKIQLVQLGLIEVLTKTLSSKNATVSSIETSLKLLSAVSTCRGGREAIREDPNCVGSIVERVMKVSKTATGDAVMVLWSLCCLFGDKKVQEMVVKKNGLTKVLLVMQSEEGEGNVKMMCAELVKVLKNGVTLTSYDTRTTHIMPC
ncbi:U-box domain-containing protein 29 [Euphorbia peplus]|nr:U-box domain-containing protein 29 [Euphorbia peplus]